MIKLVIFDMAGTAIDENNLVYKTIRDSLDRHGVEVPLSVVLDFGAGKEKWDAIHDILKEVEGVLPNTERVDMIHADFKEMLAEAYDVAEMRVFPGATRLMNVLRSRHIKIGFNTGYTRPVAKQILKKVGLVEGKDIDVLVTADMVDHARPAPDMIQAICETLQVPASHAIKVGDSCIDIDEGRNGGVRCAIGITTGAQTRTKLQESDPDFIIDDMMEMVPILDDLEEEA